MFIRIPQELEMLLPEAESKSAINAMVRNYDLTGDFFKRWREEESFFNKYFGDCIELTDCINQYAREQAQKDKNNYWPNNTIQSKIRSQQLDIYRVVLDYLESKAKIISENREHLRIKVGSTINYDECELHFPYNGNIEFYKDGGWGIGTDKGIVLFKNHLMRQPSKIRPLYRDKNSSLRIIQDRDTKKYGIISFETFEEIIHCHYEDIKKSSFYEGNGYDAVEKHYLKTLKEGKWGCFDENCALLINCLYRDIQYKNGYYECIRDGDYLCYDTIPSSRNDKWYDSIYVGKKDLYDSEGILQIGGYDELDFQDNYLLFYWGTKYDRYYVKEDLLDATGCETIKLSKLRLSFEKSQCLVVDRNFNSIMKHNGDFFHVSKGRIFNNLEELKESIPSSLLFPYKVSLNLNEGFVYLINERGSSFVYTSWSEDECDFFKGFRQGWKDELIEDDTVIVIHYSNEMNEEWRTCVNETGAIVNIVDGTELFKRYYRIGSKYGFYSSKGIDYNMVDAIIENINGETFVAKIDRNINAEDIYERHVKARILYYKKNDDGMYQKLNSINDIYSCGRLDCTIPISFPYTDYTTITNYIYGPFEIPLNESDEERAAIDAFIASLRAKKTSGML